MGLVQISAGHEVFVLGKQTPIVSGPSTGSINGGLVAPRDEGISSHLASLSEMATEFSALS